MSTNKKELIVGVKFNLFLICVFIVFGCTPTRLKSNKSPNHVINRFRSSEFNMNYLTVNCLDKETGKALFPAGFHINGLILQSKDSNGISMTVLPGRYNVKGGFIGMQWSSYAHVNLNKGDSIIINFYLEPDSTMNFRTLAFLIKGKKTKG